MVYYFIITNMIYYEYLMAKNQHNIKANKKYNGNNLFNRPPNGNTSGPKALTLSRGRMPFGPIDRGPRTSTLTQSLDPRVKCSEPIISRKGRKKLRKKCKNTQPLPKPVAPEVTAPTCNGKPRARIVIRCPTCFLVPLPPGWVPAPEPPNPCRREVLYKNFNGNFLKIQLKRVPVQNTIQNENTVTENNKSKIGFLSYTHIVDNINAILDAIKNYNDAQENDGWTTIAEPDIEGPYTVVLYDPPLEENDSYEYSFRYCEVDDLGEGPMSYETTITIDPYIKNLLQNIIP